MGKYDGLSVKELKARLLDADKLKVVFNNANSNLEKMARSEKEAKEVTEKQLADSCQEVQRNVNVYNDAITLLQNKIHDLSHDLEYENKRRISSENARFDLEQRLHGLSNTHVKVPAIREIMPGLRIDRNGDIA